MVEKKQKFDSKPLLPTRRRVFRGLVFVVVLSLYLAFRSIQLPPFPAPQSEYDVYPDTDYPLRPNKEPWDISTSFPYPRKFQHEVSEGTWLRIATHPLRREIVFDMLGDLYCYEINDEETNFVERARPFLQGVPFEKEVEFSADGTKIVFTSDAGYGVDNIWTLPYTTCSHMAATGSDILRSQAIQQTNSTFRFFSSPAFHPALPKIVATKWFLTGRPNGAGEIWEFPLHTSPSSLGEREGRRMIARNLPPSWAPDRYSESQLGAEQARYVGENGDGIIFTRNIRDDLTGMFSYNKDVHAGTNAVFLHNITKNSTEMLVNAKPGGANMPRLSHDGKTLAFVRRVKEKSVLAVKDMSSGTIHYVWKELTYDVSLIPAFMGAYPNYGFSAGDKSIIIWSSGKIWEVPLKFNHLGERVAAEDPCLLPFTAEIDLALAPTRYSENDVRKSGTEDSSQVSALRNLRSNLAGNKVIFEAAGSIQTLDITHNVVSPVPSHPFSQYYSAAFSLGGSHIITARWSDHNLTLIDLVDLAAGTIIQVTGVPRGRYLSPVIGCGKIALVRTGADYMFGDVEETAGVGVWLGDINLPIGKLPDDEMSATVSNLRKISDIGSEDTKLDFKSPWGSETCLFPDQNKLVVATSKGVWQFNQDDGTSQLLATGKTSMEMEISRPSLKSFSDTLPGFRAPHPVVAFKDFQHIWLAPSDRQHIKIWSKPGTRDTPKDLLRLSQTGGHDITFSGDGRKIFWLSGPKLFLASVDELRTKCTYASVSSRDSGDCASHFIQEIPIHVTYETDQAKLRRESDGKSLALVNASLISMDSDLPSILHNATVIITGGSIEAVGVDIQIPKGSHVISLDGGALLPGFVDVHGHWGGFLSQYPSVSWELESFLGYGVTTIHNPSSTNVGGNIENMLVEKGAFYGPRIYHTGTVLYGSTRPDCYTEINSLEDARDALLRVKIEGGNSSLSVKNYQLQPRSARQRLLLEAGKLDMLVVPEGGWSLDWDITYFIDGMTTLEHPVPIPELFDDVLGLIIASGSSITQVAVMNYGGIFGQHWVHQNNDIPENYKLQQYVKHDILEMLTEVKQAPKHSYQFFNTTKSVKKLADAGVRTNIGAHGEQPIGFLFHEEMKIHEIGGQTPYQVLKAATLGGATSLGLQSSIGSITRGKFADLVIYPPGFETIDDVWKHSKDMKYVVKGGRVFEVADGLEELWPRQGRRLYKGRINAEDEE